MIERIKPLGRPAHDDGAPRDDQDRPPTLGNDAGAVGAATAAMRGA